MPTGIRADGAASGLLQTANARHAPECLIKRNDFTGPGLDGNLSNQVIGEPNRTLAGGFQNSPGQCGRLDGHAPRLEQALDCAQYLFSVPPATKHPRQFSQNKKRNEYTACRTRCCKGRAPVPAPPTADGFP